jgi:LysM repeat protein
MTTAADLARYKNMSLSDAADILAKASTGQAKGLRDIGIAMGITIDKGATYEEILMKIQERIGGTADAFSKTAAGKMAIFGVQVDELKEKIGFALLPAFIKVVDFVNKRVIPAFYTFFKFISDNKKIVIGFAAAIAAIWTVNKINVAVMAIVAAIRILVGAYNMLKASAAVAYVAQMLALNPLLGVAAAATLGLIMAKAAQWASKSDVKVEDPTGLKDTNWGDIGDGLDNNVVKPLTAAQKALVDARQAAIDFRVEMVKAATDAYGKWKSLVKRDTKDAIRFGLLDPTDQLIEKTGTLMRTYETASGKFAGANSKLTAAQKAYEKAVKGTNESLIKSTASALKQAEDMMKAVQGDISKSLDDLRAHQDAIVDAIVDAYKKIDELKKDRLKVIEDANEEETKVTKQHLKDLASLKKQYDKDVANANAESVKASAEVVKQSVDQIRGIYRSATNKSVGDIFSNLTFGGKYSKGGSISAITGALGLQLDKAKTLADDAAKLSGLGFTQTFIEEVIALGPDVGHELSQTIIKSTPAQIKELQSMWQQLNTQTQHGVDAIAKTMNSGLTLATEELTASLAQVGKDLATTLASLLTEYKDSEAEMIKSFNETVASITAARDKATAGIDAQIKEQETNIGKLEKALDVIKETPAPSTNAIVPFIPSEDLPAAVKPTDPAVTPAVKAAVASSKYVVKAGDTLSKIAKENNTTLAKILKDNPKFTEVDKYKGGNMIWAGTTVNIAATTNATSQSIANDVGWAIRTSSDVQYGSGVNTTTLAGVQAASTPAMSSSQVLANRRLLFGEI